MKKYKSGFTLAEILLSMTIIGVIMALSVGSIKSVKSSYTTLAYFAHKNVVDMVGILYGGTMTSSDRTRRTGNANNVTANGTTYHFIKQIDSDAATNGYYIGQGKQCSKYENGQCVYYTNQVLGVDQLKYGNEALQPMVTQCKINDANHKGYGKLVNVLKNDKELYAASGLCGADRASASGSSQNLFCKSLIALTNNSGSNHCTLYKSAIQTGASEPSFTNLNPANPNFTLTNGMRVYISEWNFDASNISSIYGYRLIGVDLNGKTGPNREYDGSKTPADIVTFLVLDNGEVYPLGIAADNLVDKKNKTLQYLNARVKGYYFNYYKRETCSGSGDSASCTKERITTSDRSTIPSECLSSSLADKFKCNFGVVPIQNSRKVVNGKNITSFSYRDAICTAKNASDLEYSSYCSGYTKSTYCPPTTMSKNDGAFDMCKAETVKPVFRFNF